MRFVDVNFNNGDINNSTEQQIFDWMKVVQAPVAETLVGQHNNVMQGDLRADMHRCKIIFYRRLLINLINTYKTDDCVEYV